jgi:hypothetical protein
MRGALSSSGEVRVYKKNDPFDKGELLSEYMKRKSAEASALARAIEQSAIENATVGAVV